MAKKPKNWSSVVPAQPSPKAKAGRRSALSDIDVGYKPLAEQNEGWKTPELGLVADHERTAAADGRDHVPAIAVASQTNSNCNGQSMATILYNFWICSIPFTLPRPQAPLKQFRQILTSDGYREDSAEKSSADALPATKPPVIACLAVELIKSHVAVSSAAETSKHGTCLAMRTTASSP